MFRGAWAATGAAADGGVPPPQRNACPYPSRQHDDNEEHRIRSTEQARREDWLAELVHQLIRSWC